MEDSIRILILGPDGLVRQGLLRSFEQVQPSGWEFQECAPSSLGLRLMAWQPDVLVWDRPAPAALSALPKGLAVLALLDGDGDGALELLHQGVLGLAFRDGDGARMCDAIAALLQGIAAIDAPLLQAVLAPAPATPELFEALTPREHEVLMLLAEGLSNKEIGKDLHVSEHTAKFHVNGILGKLAAQSRTEAVVKAARMGLLHL